VNEYCPATAIIENIHDLENRLRLQPGGHNHGAVERDLDMPYLRRAIGRRAITLGLCLSGTYTMKKSLGKEHFIVTKY